MHSKIHQICETKSKKNIKYSVQKRSKQYYTKNQSKLYTACSDVVGEDGFEPSKSKTTDLQLGVKKPLYMKWFLVGEDGFEPSKSKTTDLQSAPFGRSGTLPNYEG